MRETKRRLASFAFYDRSGIEKYLERQAQAGWMLEKIGDLFWGFRRIEPKRIRFCVVYCAKAPVLGSGRSDAEMELADFCEHTGWKLAASCGKMQIFWNGSPDPVPLETDAVLSVSAIHSMAKKSYLPTSGLLVAATLVKLVTAFSKGWPNSLPNVCTLVLWVLLFAYSLMDVVGYYHWYRQAKAAAALDGSFLETSAGWFRRLRSLMIVCVTVLWVCSFAFGF